MGHRLMLYLRMLGGINLALTIYRVTTFQWGQGSHSHLNHCLVHNGQHIAPLFKILCMMYNTKRSFKILWGIRSFFTLVLFIKRVRSSRSCYGFWFISTVAELCIKVYLVQNGGMDPPGMIQFVIELVMVYMLTALLTTASQRLKQASANSFAPISV